MDNLIINSQFIGSQQTHRKKWLHQIELQEHRGEHCIKDQKGRRSHLATKYEPEGLWQTTHASSEGQQGWSRAPPWSIPPPAEYRRRPPDGISREQKLAAVEKVFRGLPWRFLIFSEFIVVEFGQTELRWAHEAPGRACPPGTPWWLFWPPPEASSVFYVQKKSPKSFMAFGLRLVLIFCKTKKQAKNSNWHWALS